MKIIDEVEKRVTLIVVKLFGTPKKERFILISFGQKEPINLGFAAT
jgi:hypothetical protein